MEEQNWISTRFIPLCQNNEDQAYQLILKHGIGVISQTNNNLILKPDGTPIDFITITQQIVNAIRAGTLQRRI